MFDNEIAINKLQIGLFEKITAEIPDEDLFRPSPGHGHPPVWILGHLAITGQMGQSLLGGEMSLPDWVELFGPGSSDAINEDPALTASSLHVAVVDAYDLLQKMAAEAKPLELVRPHEFDLFRDTPIQTIGQLVALLLTNHFGFHLAQLSSCRRAAGRPALF